MLICQEFIGKSVQTTQAFLIEYNDEEGPVFSQNALFLLKLIYSFREKDRKTSHSVKKFQRDTISSFLYIYKHGNIFNVPKKKQ